MARAQARRECSQEGLCPSWDNCPFGRDVRKCIKAIDLAQHEEDEIESID